MAQNGGEVFHLGFTSIKGNSAWENSRESPGCLVLGNEGSTLTIIKGKIASTSSYPILLFARALAFALLCQGCLDFISSPTVSTLDIDMALDEAP